MSVEIRKSKTAAAAVVQRADIRRQILLVRGEATAAPPMRPARPSIRKPAAPPFVPRSLRRQNIHFEQDDAPASHFGAGGFMHLVLLLVALNMAVCLLAGKAASVAEREIKTAFMPWSGDRRPAETGDVDLGRAAAVTPTGGKP